MHRKCWKSTTAEQTYDLKIRQRSNNKYFKQDWSINRPNCNSGLGFLLDKQSMLRFEPSDCNWALDPFQLNITTLLLFQMNSLPNFIRKQVRAAIIIIRLKEPRKRAYEDKNDTLTS